MRIMSDQRYFVVRTDDEAKDWMWQEIRSGRIRQGWGLTGMGLMEDQAEVPLVVWKSRYKDAAHRMWGVEVTDDEATKRYGILLPMTTMASGDRIVVPKIPQWDTFALAEVDQGYTFDDAPAEQRGDHKDYRHTISVRNVKHFHYHSREKARIIHKKMRAYQSAVNKVWNQDFLDAVETLLTRESETSILGIAEIFGTVKDELAASLLTRVRKMGWRDLENLVESLFKESGYEVVERHRYDGQGGDADLVVTTKLPLLDEFTDMDLNIYVQVKNKDGKDYDDVHHVEQLIKISRDAVNSLKVLISTTDEFTPEAKRHAQENNVILLDGMGLVRLLNRYL
jgi:hypothetical protein